MKFYEVTIERTIKSKLILRSDEDDINIIRGNLRGYTETCLADESDFYSFAQYNNFSDKVTLEKELTQSEVENSSLRFWIREDHSGEYEKIEPHTLKPLLNFSEALDYCAETGNKCRYGNIELTADDDFIVTFIDINTNTKLKSVDTKLFSNELIWEKV